MKCKRVCTLMVVICLLVGISGCSKEQPTKNDDMLSVGVASLSGTFNPLYTTTLYDSYVTDLVYDSLLSRDYNGKRCGALAKDIPEISEDYKTYTFHLKENVKFSSGKPLTANDVAFSFMLLADPAYDGPYMNIVSNLVGYDEYHNNEAEQFQGIEVVDKQTIIFHFKEGYRSNIDNLATHKIMSKASFPDYEKGNLDSIKESVNKPVGSGPYVLKNWESDTGAILEKNKFYERDGHQIKTINIKPITPASTLLELEKGNIDILPETSDPELIAPAYNHKDLTLNNYHSAGLSWLTLNCQSGPTADRNVRKALTLAFDREAFIKNSFGCADCGNDITLAYLPKIFQNPISSLNEYVTGKKTLDGLEEDSYHMKEAKKLLKESGWIVGKDGIRYKDGKKLTIKVMMAVELASADTLIAMWKEDWSKLGVDLKVTTLEINSMIAKASDDTQINDWSAFVLSSVFSSDDLDSIYNMFHSSTSGEGGNLARVQKEEIDALLDKGKQTLDASQVDAVYLELAKVIHNEFAYIPMYSKQMFDIYNKRVFDFRTSSYYPWTKALKEAKIK